MLFFEETPSRNKTSREDKEGLYRKQKGRCMYCGCRLGIHHFHVDHKNPINRSGSNTIRNKQLLCGPCNSRKGDLTDGEFRRTYKLRGSRVAKSPPKKKIPQEYFQRISREIAAKNAARRKRESGWF